MTQNTRESKTPQPSIQDYQQELIKYRQELEDIKKKGFIGGSDKRCNDLSSKIVGLGKAIPETPEAATTREDYSKLRKDYVDMRMEMQREERDAKVSIKNPEDNLSAIQDALQDVRIGMPPSRNFPDDVKTHQQDVRIFVSPKFVEAAKADKNVIPEVLLYTGPGYARDWTLISDLTSMGKVAKDTTYAHLTKEWVRVGRVIDWQTNHVFGLIANCSANLSYRISEDSIEWQHFVTGKRPNHRLNIEKFTQHAYEHQWLKCTAAKEYGIKELHSAEDGVGDYISGLNQQDQAAARQIKRKAAVEVANSLGMHCYWYIYTAKGKDAVKTLTTQFEPQNQRGFFHFVHGDMLQAMRELPEDRKKTAALSNPISSVRGGGRYLGMNPGTVDEQITQQTSFLSTFSVTLNPDLRTAFEPGRFTEVEPLPPQFHLNLPDEKKSQLSTSSTSQILLLNNGLNSQSEDTNKPPSSSSARENSTGGFSSTKILDCTPPISQIGVDKEAPPPDPRRNSRRHVAHNTPWFKIFLVVLACECTMVAIPSIIAGFAKLAEAGHFKHTPEFEAFFKSFDAADIKNVFFGSPQATLGTVMGISIAIAVLVFLLVNAAIYSRPKPPVSHDSNGCFPTF